MRVAVAMSGGVDSSVAAYILKEEGHDVFGITMAVIPGYSCQAKKRTEDIISDAKKVADRLAIEHHVLDLRENFQREVIDYFAAEYKAGRTPNPCVMCNRKIKFGDLFDEARRLGAEYIVTGHYGRIERDDQGRALLMKAGDSKKDQTYFLYNIRRENLDYIMMPLKDYSKDQVRKIGEKIGLEISEKPDSEEICFIPDEDHARFIEEDLGEESLAGDFVDREGNFLARHKGLIHYTIGQRRGLGVALGRRIYVVDIIPEKNQVVLGDEGDIFKSKLYAKDVNLLALDELPESLEAKAKIRSTAREEDVIVKPYRDGMLVEFKEPQRAITKGQAIVLYDGDLVLGGGTIDRIY